MNVLFLDYDGVVNTPMWNKEGTKCRYNFPSDGSVNNFQAAQWVSEFCEKYNYFIVVTSTWRQDSNWKECLIRGGLRSMVNILCCTPFDPQHNRGNEIKEFLKHHPEVDNFIILDDEKVKGFSSHLILCKWSCGFCEEDYLKAVRLHNKLLNKKLAGVTK